MGQIPPIKGFPEEDYPKLPANFLNNLSSTIRILANTLTKAVNFQNISGENFSRVYLQIGRTITPGDPLRVQFSDNQKTPPVAVWCSGIWRKNMDSSDSIGAVVTIEWDYDSVTRQLIIKRINGITQPFAVDYEITITALGA